MFYKLWCTKIPLKDKFAFRFSELTSMLLIILNKYFLLKPIKIFFNQGKEPYEYFKLWHFTNYADNLSLALMNWNKDAHDLLEFRESFGYPLTA